MVADKKNTNKPKSTKNTRVTKRVVRKRSTKATKSKKWPMVTLSLILLILLFGSIAAAFFVIFFSVPEVRASELSSISSEKMVKPRVAIIIDDMGYNLNIGESLIKIPYDLSFSFLPFAPHSRQLQKASYLAGKTMLVHLPLEPKNSELSLEPNSLLLSQSADKQRQLFAENIAAVPLATGLNNHMGSLFTADPVAMKRLLQLAHEQNYFFVDSITTVHSVGKQTAEKIGIPHCQRDVFLDNVAEKDAICNQLNKLVTLAEKHGSAIGIGHPYPATLNALQSCLKTSLKDLDLVSVEQLVE